MSFMMDEEDRLSLNATNYTGTSNFSEPDSLNVVVSLSVIYTFILVVGISGNISTCIVIGRNRSMHTSTNFYLFSLAISDLFLLICGLPLEVHRLWKPFAYPLGEALCITIALISETSANATVLTITAFTIERYIAICHPFMSHKMSKLSRVVKYIIAIWICALCSAVPQIMQFGIVSFEENKQIISSCTVKGHGVEQVFVISSFIFFVVPMSLITVLYVLIGFKLHSSRILHTMKKSSVESSERCNSTPRYRNGASQRKVIWMLIAVALSFFLCWAPFHVQRLIAIYGNNLEQPTDTFYEVYVILTSISGVLYFLSTAINPFLYNIMSNKFRNAFKVTLSSLCIHRQKSRLEKSYSALLTSQRERAATRVSQRSHDPLLLRRLSTASSQLSFACPRAQSLNQDILSVVNEEPESCVWRPCFAERLDFLTSPQSISNSSLREVEQELSGEEIVTYLYQVNHKITGKT